MNENPNEGRRNFLKGIFAAGAMLTLKPFVQLAEAAQGLDLGVVRKQFKEFFSKNSNALDTMHPPQMNALLNAMHVVNGRSIKGTEYDFEGVPAGAMKLESEKGFGNGIVLRFHQQRSEGFGLDSRYVLVAPRHVADKVDAPNAKKWTRHPSLDMSMCELSADEAKSSGSLFLARKQKSLDLSGELVCVLGHDTSDSTGEVRDVRKNYPAILSPRLSAPVYTQAFDYEINPINWKGETDIRQGPYVRMIVLPDGEGRLGLEKIRVAGKESVFEGLPVQGMSGAPMVYLPDGPEGVKRGSRGVEFAGFLVAGVEAVVNKKPYSLAFVIDQQLVWDMIEARLPPPNQNRVTLSGFPRLN